MIMLLILLALSTAATMYAICHADVGVEDEHGFRARPPLSPPPQRVRRRGARKTLAKLHA